MGAGDCFLCQALVREFGAKRRGNAGGRETKKAGGTRGWVKPLALEGERLLMAPAGPDLPLSCFHAIENHYRMGLGSAGFRVGRAAGLGSLKREVKSLNI